MSICLPSSSRPILQSKTFTVFLKIPITYAYIYHRFLPYHFSTTGIFQFLDEDVILEESSTEICLILNTNVYAVPTVAHMVGQIIDVFVRKWNFTSNHYRGATEKYHFQIILLWNKTYRRIFARHSANKMVSAFTIEIMETFYLTHIRVERKFYVNFNLILYYRTVCEVNMRPTLYFSNHCHIIRQLSSGEISRKPVLLNIQKIL